MSNCGNLQKYQSRNPVQRLLINRFLDTAAALVRPLSLTSVLDAGSGEGFVSHHLFGRRPQVCTVAVDVDAEALARGRTLHPEIAFQSASVTDLPFDDDAFDLVLCNEVLEHLPEPELALGELLRVSRRYLLLSVPNEPFFRGMNFVRGKNITRLGDDIDHCNHWGALRFRRFVADYVNVIAYRYPLPWQIVFGEVPKSQLG